MNVRGVTPPPRVGDVDLSRRTVLILGTGTLVVWTAAISQLLFDDEPPHGPTLKPPPKGTKPPKPRRTLYGMNVSPGDTFAEFADETAEQQVDRIVTTFGALPAAKVFYQGPLPPEFNTDYEGLVPGKVVYVCFKGAIDIVTIQTYCDSIPSGWTVYLIYFQEPDDEIWVDRSFTIDSYRAEVNTVLDAVRPTNAYVDGRAKVGQCFMEYSLTVGRWNDSVVVEGIDLLAWDFYSNTASEDPTDRIEAMAAVSERVGIKHWAVLEIGDSPTTFPDGDARAAYWTYTLNQMSDLGATALVWFNAIGSTGDHRIIPGEPYSDPMVKLLGKRMDKKRSSRSGEGRPTQ